MAIQEMLGNGAAAMTYRFDLAPLLAISFLLGACNGAPSASVNVTDNFGAEVDALEARTNRVSGEAANFASDAGNAVAPEPIRDSAAPVSGGETPSYDVARYCRQVGDAVGGSSVIERGCRDQEQEAQARIRSRTIPARVRSYCDQVARAVGGSYMIFDGCLDQELEAASSL
jgi:hypothetical protein